MSRELHDFIAFGPFRLNAQERLLLRDGKAVALPPKTLDLLLVLVENCGHLVEKEELMNRLWPGTFVEEANLSHHVFTLRRALGDGENAACYIETVPRRGYRFVAPVNGMGSEAATAGSGSALPADREFASTTRRFSMRLVLLATLSILAAAIVLVLIRTSKQDTRRTPAAPTAITSLAVLPLRNLSNDVEQAYFVDGMTEALISTLGKIRALKVISRTSVMQYEETKKSLQEIAKELSVDGIVEGAVLQVGDRVRITVRLIEVKSERQLWAGAYVQDLSNVLVLQNEVARAIAREVRIAVTPEEQETLARAEPVDPEAHRAYLRGVFFWNKRSVKALRTALEYFQEASTKDPGYAPAHAMMADTLMQLGYRQGPPRDYYPKARQVATQALRIDNKVAAAHVVLAAVLRGLEHDWLGAEKALRRAIELDPGSSMAHQRYSLHLTSQGRVEESLAEMQRALELDPVSLVINTSLAGRLYYARRYEEAIQQAQSVIRMDQDFGYAHRVLGLAYLQKGMFVEAIAALEKAAAGSSSPDQGQLGYAYAAAGAKRKAWQKLAELRRLSRRQYVSPYDFALVYCGLGDSGQALKWLDRAYDDRSPELNLLNVEPLWDKLRPEPQFQNLLRRMRFPAQGSIPGQQ